MKKKRGCLSIIGTFFVCILIVAAIGYFFGDKSEHNILKKTTAASETKTTAPAITKPTKTVTHKLNETVQYDNIEVKINKVVFSQYAGNISGFNKAQLPRF